MLGRRKVKGPRCAPGVWRPSPQLRTPASLLLGRGPGEVKAEFQAGLLKLAGVRVGRFAVVWFSQEGVGLPDTRK